MNNKNRIYLRSLSSKLPDLVYIGKEGLTDNVKKQINDNLFVYELIKIKVQKNANSDIKIIAKLIETDCKCEVISLIGSKIVCYKYSTKDKIKHII